MKKIIRILGQRGRTTIPAEIRSFFDISDHDILSYEATESGAVIVRKERLCTCCEEAVTPTNKKETLLDFLNSLSPEQKAAALVHLSMQVANQQGSAEDA